MAVDGDGRSRAGVMFALGAFTFWGFTPVFFKLIEHVSPLEVVAHRVVWSVALIAPMLLVMGGAGRFVSSLKERRILLALAASALLIAVNWLIFVWAIIHDRVLEASLGYFINPLVNVVLGMAFFSERLRRAQWFAVGLAASGVIILVVSHGSLPWVSIALPITFGFYGLIRKRVDVDSLHGLLTETLMLLPIAAAYIAYAGVRAEGVFLREGLGMNLMLFALGPITIFPLTCFAASARRINLSTLGFIHYIAPSLTFLLAVFLFNEPFGPAQLVTFVLIWISLVIFSLDGYRYSRTPAR